VSLYDMLRPYALLLSRVEQFLFKMSTNLNLYARPDAQLNDDWASEFKDMMPLCEEIGLTHAASRIRRILKALESPMTAGDMRDQMNTLSEDLEDQLESAQFLHVPRTDLYEGVSLFGVEVDAKFPKAAFNIRESGACIAVGRSTAAVFHSMCVLEVGIDSLAYALGLPCSQKNWNVILQDIETAVNAIGPQSGGAWREDKEFYSKAAIEFKYFREVWRNHTAHGRSKFTEAEADKVFEHVKDFMMHLSTRLTERP
jgi:hypothetical protein